MIQQLDSLVTPWYRWSDIQYLFAVVVGRSSVSPGCPFVRMTAGSAASFPSLARTLATPSTSEDYPVASSSAIWSGQYLWNTAEANIPVSNALVLSSWCSSSWWYNGVTQYDNQNHSRFTNGTLQSCTHMQGLTSSRCEERDENAKPSNANWARLNIKTAFPGMGIPMLKIRLTWTLLLLRAGIFR